MRSVPTIGDIILIIALVLAAGVLFYTLPGMVLSPGTHVDILTDGEVFGRYDLSRDVVVQVPGPLGTTRVGVSEGSVQVLTSPCPHKLCVKSGSIDSRGGVIVCVPNRVIVRIHSDEPDRLDAVSR